MRHLVGVLLAIVMAAAVFFGASWGYLKLLIAPASGGALPGGGGSLIHHHAVVEGFAALLAVGLLAGILIAVPRISPLASGLPGLVLLAWTGLYLFSVRRGVRYIPLKTRAYGAGFEAMLWLKKGFGFAGEWTVRRQNELLALCFGLEMVNNP